MPRCEKGTLGQLKIIWASTIRRHVEAVGWGVYLSLMKEEEQLNMLKLMSEISIMLMRSNLRHDMFLSLSLTSFQCLDLNLDDRAMLWIKWLGILGIWKAHPTCLFFRTLFKRRAITLPETNKSHLKSGGTGRLLFRVNSLLVSRGGKLGVHESCAISSKKNFWEHFPRHPNTSWKGVLGMFLGSKYLLRRCLDV